MPVDRGNQNFKLRSPANARINSDLQAPWLTYPPNCDALATSRASICSLDWPLIVSCLCGLAFRLESAIQRVDSGSKHYGAAQAQHESLAPSILVLRTRAAFEMLWYPHAVLETCRHPPSLSFHCLEFSFLHSRYTYSLISPS